MDLCYGIIGDIWFQKFAPDSTVLCERGYRVKHYPLTPYHTIGVIRPLLRSMNNQFWVSSLTNPQPRFMAPMVSDSAPFNIFSTDLFFVN